MVVCVGLLSAICPQSVFLVSAEEINTSAYDASVDLFY